MQRVATISSMTGGGGESSCSSNTARDDASKAKHKVFLSHSGSQKDFVEHLCVQLEGCYRFPFFDKRRESLPIGENFPDHIFDAIGECDVGVVILSDEFLSSKWPMMELVAMHDRVVGEVRSGKHLLKIMPIFLCLSMKEFDDLTNRSRWVSCWQKLAMENPRRVIVEKCEAAVKYLRSINGLLYDGVSELRFLKEIVDEICRVVPPEVKFEDSHIEGKLRLCKVIGDKIDVQQKNSTSRVCVVGLYGMGGIGKTSICKALCNEFFSEFRGRVCYAELERRSEEDLLRDVLKNLTEARLESLGRLNLDQLRNVLMEGGIKDSIFLALDNMSATDASINEARSYLSAKLPVGSIVMVTSRSRTALLKLRSYIDESSCLEMPELMLEEAKRLFMRSCGCELGGEVDEQLMDHCVKQCYFKKVETNGTYHYHPLALDVLGRQLGCMDPKQWGAHLDKIGEGTSKLGMEGDHAIFCILRTSFDTLMPDDQMLFMDIGLFLPWFSGAGDVLEWLCILQKSSSVKDVMSCLERLESKSLVERLGEGMETRIGMHDLWRAFCEAEVEHGELGCRRWVMQKARKSSELLEASPCGSCWENVRRMSLVDCEFSRLERVNFGHFVNVRVLKISGLCMTRKVVVDVSRLCYLQSLEVSGRFLHRLVLQGLPKSLIFLSVFGELRFYSDSSQSIMMGFLGPLYKRWRGSSKSLQWIGQIGCLKELEFIRLCNYRGGKVPDMRNMVSLRKAIFCGCENLVSVSGLSSKLSNLRVLDLGGCEELRTCEGLGDLIALEELDLRGCRKLKRLPNLQKLRNLRRLNITYCGLIIEVPGLGDLVALEKFYAGENFPSPIYFRLPDMLKLSHLQELVLRDLRLEAASGWGSLVSLQVLDADFRWVEDRPSLKQLTKLQVLKVYGWSSEELGELDDMVMLQTLVIGYCRGVDKLPDFRGLISLQSLRISWCDFKDVSSLRNLSALRSLEIWFCDNLEGVPNLEKPLELSIWDCDMVRGLDSTVGEVEGNVWRSDEASVQCDLPDPQWLRNLRELRLCWCKNLEDLTSIGACSQLERLECSGLGVSELPDLSNFPRLEEIKLFYCESLRRLTSREPIHALWNLSLWNCSSLTELPDLGMLPSSKELWLEGCSGLTTLSSSRPLHSLEVLDVRGCSSLSGDAIDEFRAMLRPKCEIKQYRLDVHVDTGVGREWMWRAVGAGGMVLAFCWIFRSLRRSQA